MVLNAAGYAKSSGMYILGTYYLKETLGETYKVFVLTVDEDGVGYRTEDQADPSKVSYSNKIYANG